VEAIDENSHIMMSNSKYYDEICQRKPRIVNDHW